VEEEEEEEGEGAFPPPRLQRKRLPLWRFWFERGDGARCVNLRARNTDLGRAVGGRDGKRQARARAR
jgi:hypothetical protein